MIFIILAVLILGLEVGLLLQVYHAVLAHDIWGIVYWMFWSWIWSKIAAGIEEVVEK